MSSDLSGSDPLPMRIIKSAGMPVKPEDAELTPMEAVVKVALVLMMTQANPPELTKATRVAWVQYLEHAGIEWQEVGPAVAAFCSKNKWFPAPSEIITAAKANRPKKKPEMYRIAEEVLALPPPPLTEDQKRQRRVKMEEVKSKYPRLFRDGLRKVGPSIETDVIITQEDIDRRDEMIAKVRAEKGK